MGYQKNLIWRLNLWIFICDTLKSVPNDINNSYDKDPRYFQKESIYKICSTSEDSFSYGITQIDASDTRNILVSATEENLLFV